MRLDAQMKADLEQLAKADNRSLTNYVETVLQKHVDLSLPLHDAVNRRLARGRDNT